jgi:hypothetical protein
MVQRLLRAACAAVSVSFFAALFVWVQTSTPVMHADAFSSDSSWYSGFSSSADSSFTPTFSSSSASLSFSSASSSASSEIACLPQLEAYDTSVQADELAVETAVSGVSQVDSDYAAIAPDVSALNSALSTLDQANYDPATDQSLIDAGLADVDTLYSTLLADGDTFMADAKTSNDTMLGALASTSTDASYSSLAMCESFPTESSSSSTGMSASSESSSSSVSSVAPPQRCGLEAWLLAMTSFRYSTELSKYNLINKHLKDALDLVSTLERQMDAAYARSRNPALDATERQLAANLLQTLRAEHKTAKAIERDLALASGNQEIRTHAAEMDMRNAYSAWRACMAKKD